MNPRTFALALLGILSGTVVLGGCGSVPTWRAPEYSPPEDPAQARLPVLVPQTGHQKLIRAMALSPDGKYLLTGSADQSAILWNTASQQVIHRLSLHQKAVTSVAFVPGKPRLLTGSEDGTVGLWDLVSGRCLAVVEVANLILGGFSSGGPLQVLSLAVSPDGKTFACGTSLNSYLFDLETGKNRVRLSGGVFTRARGSKVHAVAFSPDGKYVAVGHDRGGVYVWTADEGADVWAQSSFEDPIVGISFSRDSRSLAVAVRNSVKVFRIGEEGEGRSLDPGDHLLTCLAPDPWERVILAGTTKGHVVIWDPKSGGNPKAWNAFRTVEAPEAEAVALSPDGGTSYIALNQVVKGLETGSGRTSSILYRQQSLLQPSTVAIDSDGRFAATGSRQGPIQLWNLANGVEVRRLVGHSNLVTRVQFLADRKTLLSSSEDGTVRRWSIATGKEVLQVQEGMKEDASKRVVYDIAVDSSGDYLFEATRRGILVRNAQTFNFVRLFEPAFGDALCTQVACTPDGQKILGGILSQGARLWNTSGELIYKFGGHSGITSAVDLSTTGSLVAAGSWDGSITVWRADRPFTLLHRLKSPSRKVDFVRFTPDGKRLLTAAEDRIVVWNVETGGIERALQGISGRIDAMEVSPNGNLLVTVGQDATQRVWDLKEGRELYACLRTADGQDLIFTPEGHFDGSSEVWPSLGIRSTRDSLDVLPASCFAGECLLTDLATRARGRERLAPPAILALDRRQPTVEIVKAEEVVVDSRRYGRLWVGIAEATADAEHPRGSGAFDFRLYRNGVLAVRMDGDILQSLREQQGGGFQVNVPLVAGENNLSCTVFSQSRIASKAAEHTFTGIPQGRRGKAYIVSIGVSTYKSSILELDYAHQDAQNISDYLERGLASRYGEVVPVVLQNAAATKQNIIGALDRLAGKQDSLDLTIRNAESLAKAEPEDLVVVFFAGHGGAPYKARFQYYITPHDDTSGYLSDEKLRDLLMPIQAGQFLLIIDACYAGSVVQSAEVRPYPYNSPSLAQLAFDKGMHVLLAASADKAAQESKVLGMSYLAWALLGKESPLSNADLWPVDGRISCREWLDHAAKTTSQMLGRLRESMAGSGVPASALPAEQRPSTFYRRDVDRRPLILFDLPRAR